MDTLIKKAVKRLGSATQPEQGKAYTYGKRVNQKSKKYKLYKNFKWKKSKQKFIKRHMWQNTDINMKMK